MSEYKIPNLDTLTPNSNKYKEEQKKKQQEEMSEVDKALGGAKKTLSEKPIVKDLNKPKIFSKENIKKVSSSVMKDTILPGVKNLVWGIFTAGLSTFLFGEARKPNGYASSGGIGEKISYWSGINDSRKYAGSSSSSISDFNTDGIIFRLEEDAQIALDGLDEILSRYHRVRVQDFYDMAQVTTTNYMTNSYGWYDLRGASIIRVSEGWILHMPKAVPLR